MQHDAEREAPPLDVRQIDQRNKLRSGHGAHSAPPAREIGQELIGHDTSLFPRLVLGWIEADFRIQILVRIFQHFSKSTRKSSSREQI